MASFLTLYVSHTCGSCNICVRFTGRAGHVQFHLLPGRDQGVLCGCENPPVTSGGVSRHRELELLILCHTTGVLHRGTATWDSMVHRNTVFSCSFYGRSYMKTHKHALLYMYMYMYM